MPHIIRKFYCFRPGPHISFKYAQHNHLRCRGWEKYLSKRSLIKHPCSWRAKLFVLWTLNRQAKIFLRIEDSIQSKNTRIVLLSNDTDVLVLVLYFMQYFTSVGLKELWIQFGTGQNKRFIPVHKLWYELGPRMCSILFKAHILTGSDTTSKIVTKAAT